MLRPSWCAGFVPAPLCRGHRDILKCSGRQDQTRRAKRERKISSSFESAARRRCRRGTRDLPERGAGYSTRSREDRAGFLSAAAGTHAALGLAYAGLGEAASAIAEGEKAMAMRPTSKDPFEGPAIEENMAAIYALLGDADHAIPILKRLLQIPYGVLQLLRRCCDSIRSGIKSATILAFRNWPQKRNRESKELRRRSKRRECLQRCRCLCRN